MMINNNSAEKNIIDENEYTQLVSEINTQFEQLIKSLKKHNLNEAHRFVGLGYDIFVKNVFDTLQTDYKQD